MKNRAKTALIQDYEIFCRYSNLSTGSLVELQVSINIIGSTAPNIEGAMLLSDFFSLAKLNHIIFGCGFTDSNESKFVVS